MTPTTGTCDCAPASSGPGRIGGGEILFFVILPLMVGACVIAFAVFAGYQWGKASALSRKP